MDRSGGETVGDQDAVETTLEVCALPDLGLIVEKGRRLRRVKRSASSSGGARRTW